MFFIAPPGVATPMLLLLRILLSASEDADSVSADNVLFSAREAVDAIVASCCFHCVTARSEMAFKMRLLFSTYCDCAKQCSASASVAFESSFVACDSSARHPLKVWRMAQCF